MEGKSKEIGEGNSETPVAEWGNGNGQGNSRISAPFDRSGSFDTS